MEEVRTTDATQTMDRPRRNTRGAARTAARLPSLLRQRPTWDALAAGVIALALYVAFRGGFPANDSWHTLLWGSELASGRLPDYQAPLAPTPHPLLILYAAALSPLGNATGTVLQLTAMVALGATAVGLFRLGTRLFAWPVGLLAAVILLTRDRFLYLGVRGNVDVMALALIVWAAVLEAGRSRRGWPVLALLSLAGLLRPEAWLFAGAYWLWLLPDRDPRARVALGALPAAAPLLWALSDFLVTGDPLWSLHGTQSLAGVLERRTGLEEVPDSAWRALKGILKPAILIVGLGGLVAGLVFRARATVLPAAILVVAAAAFVGLGVFSLPLNSRYLLPAALSLALLAAVAALGWIDLPLRPNVKAVWRTAGVLTAVLVLVLLGWQLPLIYSVREKIVARGAVGGDLQALLQTGPVSRAFVDCAPLISPSNFRRPQLAYLTGRPEESLGVARPGVPLERGVYVRANRVADRVNGYGPSSFKDFRRDFGPPESQSPPGFSQIARSRFWIAYSSCGSSGADGARGGPPNAPP
jgi:hypothetical protein